MKYFISCLAILLLGGTLQAQNPELEKIIQYRNQLRDALKQPAEDRAAWEEAMRGQSPSRIRATYEAFSQSSKKAYDAIEEIPVLEGDPGYHAACKEYALWMYMGSEGRIDKITRIALDNQRTHTEAATMDKEWSYYWHQETEDDKNMELAELELFAHFLAGENAKYLCQSIQTVLKEAKSGFVKYKGEPTQSPFDGISAFNTNWLMPGAIKGWWFYDDEEHQFLVFTFLQDEDRDKALQYYNALSVDFTTCAFPDWNRAVYRPKFGEANPVDLIWLSCESPDREIQIRVVMGKPTGKDFYRVQLRFDVPSQMR